MPMTLISTATVGSGGAASIDFDLIPGTYTDLQILFAGRSSRAASQNPDLILLKFNDSTSNFTARVLYANGASPSSESKTTSEMAYGFTPSDATSDTFSNGIIYIPNYSGSTNKSWSMDAVTENGATLAGLSIGAGSWASSSAITKITIYAPSSRTLLQNSTASLYGILKGSGGATVS